MCNSNLYKHHLTCLRINTLLFWHWTKQLKTILIIIIKHYHCVCQFINLFIFFIGNCVLSFFHHPLIHHFLQLHSFSGLLISLDHSMDNSLFYSWIWHKNKKTISQCHAEDAVDFWNPIADEPHVTEDKNLRWPPEVIPHAIQLHSFDHSLPHTMWCFIKTNIQHYKTFFLKRWAVFQCKTKKIIYKNVFI